MRGDFYNYETVNKNMKAETNSDQLTDEEQAKLKLWASATPAQRLAWLEEMQKIAHNAGALRTSHPVAHE